jgi:CRP/FNR family cyclic AMP-dependent transcriptional regulator
VRKGRDGTRRTPGVTIDKALLQSLPLFEGLSTDELEDCASHFPSTEMLAVSSLTKEGDFAYKFFVVLEGTVEDYRDFEHVADLGPGDFFGEMGVLSHGKRNARVSAKDRCQLASMMGRECEEMQAKYPGIASRVDATVAARMSSLPDA